MNDVAPSAPPLLTLSAATPDDAELVLTLTVAAYEEYRHTLVPASGVFKETVVTVRHDLTTGGGVLLLRDGEPVGCGRCETAADGSHLYIGRLAVLPAYRQQGYAAHMINWFAEHARARGLPELRLGVRLALPRNLNLYTRLGFEIFDYETRPDHPGRVSAWMRKRLG